MTWMGAVSCGVWVVGGGWGGGRRWVVDFGGVRRLVGGARGVGARVAVSGGLSVVRRVLAWAGVRGGLAFEVAW